MMERMDPGALVARAHLRDLDALVPLFDAYRRFYGEPSDRDGARRFLEERLRRADSVIFLARGDPGDAFAGFAQLYPSFSSISLKRLWILNDLFVDPAARGRGIARGLLARARALAVETGAKGLTLATAVDNTTARALYEACGWRRDEAFMHYDLWI